MLHAYIRGSNNVLERMAMTSDDELNKESSFTESLILMDLITSDSPQFYL